MQRTYYIVVKACCCY